KKEGEFKNSEAARSLTNLLTVVERFEERREADKVVKHMENFKSLLIRQNEDALISDKAYNVLYADAVALIQKWR
ncbi:MAG: hypothetical protein LOD88_08400, partial [Novibacillus thermophilus]